MLPLPKRALGVFQLGLDLHNAATLFTLASEFDELWAVVTQRKPDALNIVFRILGIWVENVPWSRCTEFCLVFLPGRHGYFCFSVNSLPS